MLSEKEYQERLDRVQALRQRLAQRLSGSLVSNPALAEELNGQSTTWSKPPPRLTGTRPTPPDGGLAALVGIGTGGSQQFGETLTSQRRRAL